MKIKKKYIFCTLILMIGLLTISFIASADSYSSYENRCLDWGNKYTFTSLRTQTLNTASMTFGQIFRCNKSVGINVIGIYFSTVAGWGSTVISYGVKNVSQTTGLPTTWVNTSKNNFIPAAGWNKLTFAEKLNLVEGNYYALEFRDYVGAMTRTVYINILNGDNGRSSIFGRSPSGNYEPIDRFYKKLTTFGNYFTDGSVQWYIAHYYGVNLYRNMSGNIYTHFFNNPIYGGTIVRQTFKPTENMYVKSITANFLPYEVSDYINTDNLTVCLFNESSGSYMINSTLINKKEPGLIPYDTAVYNVYRPYTVELATYQYLSSSYNYSLRFRSWGSNSNSAHQIQTMTVSTPFESYFKDLTFQGRKYNTSYNFNNGSWTYNSNTTDIVFTLGQVNSSWLDDLCTTTPFVWHNNTVNVSSLKTLKLISGVYHLWDNSSSGILSYTNFINCTGTLQKAWYSALGKFKVWANVTGNATTVNLHQNIVNATGTHVKVDRGSGVVDVYANYTGNTTPITLYDDTPPGIMNIHEYGLYSTGYKVWSNVSVSMNYCDSPLIDSITENLVNCTGGIDSIYDRDIGWTLYANYTGNTTPLHQASVIVNASGTHSYTLNGTGYWDTASYTGNNSFVVIENLVNASGGYDSVWNGTSWTIWNNYTGLNGLSLFETIINASGTHDSFWNGTHWLVWANYTGNSTSCGNTSLTVIENTVNTSGIYQSAYNFTTGWTVWNNYSGLNALNFIEHLINATGNHQQYWNGSAWTIYNNYTGNASAVATITLYENIVDASGTHQYAYNGTGYRVWANYTGYSNNLIINESNMVNVTGLFDYNYNTVTGWYVYANFSGNLTPIHLFQSYINSTGTHEYALNSSGYQVWANVSGNTSSCVNLTKWLPIKGDIVMPVLLGVSMSSPGFLLLGLRRKKR